MGEKYSERDDAEFTEMWHDGAGIQEIADKTGRSYHAIKTRRPALGLPARNARVVLDGKQILRLTKLHENGVQLIEIADDLGVSLAAISRYCVKLGLRRRFKAEPVIEVDEPAPQLREDCIAAELARISDDYTARMRGES